VRRLAATESGMRRVDEVARALGLSARTLKRKLALTGVSYSELVDRERHALSLRLLQNKRLSLDEIAQKLDYSSLTNFARAFRRWTGVPPGHYRKQL
jgi:AraC-like DNA-binding protein